MNTNDIMSNDLISLRLQAVRDTQQRTKIAFWSLIILSIGIIVVHFNAYLSWYRSFALKSTFASDKSDEVVAFMQKALLNEWISSRSFQVPVIGVKVVVSDSCFLAGLTLLVGVIWFFFCQRRENHTIAALLRDTLEYKDSIKNTIYHFIVSGMVLSVMTADDQPAISFKEQENPQMDNLARFFAKTFTYFPFIAMLIVLIADILSFFFVHSPFRKNHSVPFNDSTSYDMTYQFTTSFFTSLFTFAIFSISLKADKYDDASLKLLDAYLKFKP
jgi:DNA-directed RNA polymerase subunit L